MTLKKPRIPFLGSRFAASPKNAQAALFGVPHGTPYKGIDNRPYEKAPDVLRKALKADAAFLDSWDFDFGGPLLGKDGKFRFTDLGDLPTQSKQGAKNRKLIETCALGILAQGLILIIYRGDVSMPHALY